MNPSHPNLKLSAAGKVSFVDCKPNQQKKQTLRVLCALRFNLFPDLRSSASKERRKRMNAWVPIRLLNLLDLKKLL